MHIHPEMLKDIERLNLLSREEKYKLIGLSKLLDDSGKIKIPENIKHIKIDIGLSFSAPNASLWLCETEDRIVFGVEPSPINLACLHEGFAGRNGVNEEQASMCVNEGVIYKNNKIEKSGINDRFKMLYCGFDDVGRNNPQFVPFYMTSGDPGCSSLSIPTNKLPNDVKFGADGRGLSMTSVGVISFYDFLEKVPWDRFEFIEQVKIDTQGRDLNILKSSEEYLQKIVFLQVENSTNGEYEDSHTKEEIHDFLINNDFKHISTVGVDSSYVNNKYSHLIDDLHNSVV